MPEGELLIGPPNKLSQDPNGELIQIAGLPQGAIPNHYVNFGWEYVQHCHLLGHEEMDMIWLIIPMIGVLVWEVLIRYIDRPTLWAVDIATMTYGTHFLSPAP